MVISYLIKKNPFIHVYSVQSNLVLYDLLSLIRWFAKRFLHPDIVSEYAYIFFWDEDLGVDHFNAKRFIVQVVVFHFNLVVIHSLLHACMKHSAYRTTEYNCKKLN